MKIITAIGNQEISKKIKENGIADIINTDIQYQEAVIEIIEKNKDINLLILSSILPGEFNIYEFINIIKYKNPNLEIIIILEKENEKLEKFIVAKGINNIYYNNKITFNEILEKINEIKNKNIINNKINKLEEIILEKNKKKYLNKVKNKINYLKNKNKINKNKIKNKKIITIIGAPKVGKSIFSIILSLNIKNKKILLMDFNIEKNDIKKIIGKKIKNQKNIKNNINKWKKNIHFFTISKDDYYKNILEEEIKIENFLEELLEIYDYIIIDIGDIDKNKRVIEKSEKIIILVEANLLGISETRTILEKIVNKQKNQKDKIKIIFNKQTITSIKRCILNKMFSDFEILGQLQYDKYYNFFINTNAKYITKKIKNEYLKIIKKI